ncbi:MAG TPA: aminotransferase class I/II-fold pyridoxal phosphate-dependent enzyme [Humibacter sp.]|nr:aminotransferase class I/II-fold pyridoxal phosphate-dependent enzyme [Humibacter sp.]
MDVHAEPLDKLRTRTSEKWTAYPSEVLPLFVAEMDYPLAEPIADALIAAVRRSDTGYAGTAPTALASAFASFAESRWGWQVDRERVSTSTDVSVVIVESLRRTIRPGDGVVIMPPVYPPFFDLPVEAGGRVVEVPLVLSDGVGGEPRMDLDGIDRALASGARAVLLCNPHNPLGLVHTRAELSALAEIVQRHGAVVISDEIHAPLTHSDAAFTPYLTVSDAARDHAIAAHSASKGWNLAGLKCALFVTAGDRMSSALRELPEEVHFRTSLLGRIANTAAFASGVDWLNAALRSIEANRRLLTRLLHEYIPEAEYLQPRASYLAWVDLSALGWGDDPAAVALARSGVALANGPSFGGSGDSGRGFVRVNFACSPEVLTEAVQRIAAAR